MPLVKFPYGRKQLQIMIPDQRFTGALIPDIHKLYPNAPEEQLVRNALQQPIGTLPLYKLAKGKKKIVVLASDHTRPVPSKILAPLLLEEIRRGSPEAEVTFLIATGCHRMTTKAELEKKFGTEIVQKEKIVVHNCDDDAMLVNLGTLPSGGELVINRTAVEADLLLAEGFIEPHFFAGFSGGRKSVLPGIASRKTVLYNHNAAFINDKNARTGQIEQNPVHQDMLFAAQRVGLRFICNVVINSEKQIIYAAAGDVELAHREGRSFLEKNCLVQAPLSDIVITSNGGYPLDQNIYQSVKGMTAALEAVKKDGVIIMAAAAEDGHGGEAFFKTFREQKCLAKMEQDFLRTSAAETVVDQWQSQIFVRVLRHASVIFVSEASDDMIKEFQMIPAHSLAEAVKLADQLLQERGMENGKILTIPDGVSVIVRRQ